MIGSLRSVALLTGLVFGEVAAQSPAASQSRSLPTENVTVTAPKPVPDAVLHDFVKFYTQVSLASGKIARWRMGVCPVVTGLPPAGNRLVTGRVRQVASNVGAPVGAAACKPNIDIVFTLNPQVLLDGIRTRDHVLLGYHEAAQEKGLAIVRHPVQAWYATQTADLNGATTVDDKLRNNGGFYIGQTFFSEGNVNHTSGSRLSDGVSSELYHAVIVINLAKVTGHTIGALGDYAAMLALAQTQSFEACALVASIANLVSPACDAALKSNEITDSDLAYLRGLYSIDPRDSLMRQKDEIAAGMKADLTAAR